MDLLSDDECPQNNDETIIEKAKYVQGQIINTYKDVNFINLINEYLESEINKIYICNCCHSIQDYVDLIKCCNCLCNLCDKCIRGLCEKDDCYGWIKTPFEIQDYIQLYNRKDNSIINEIFECKFCGKYKIGVDYTIENID